MKGRKTGKRASKSRKHFSSSKGKSRAPQTAEQFYAMSQKAQQIYLTVLSLVALMRDGISRTRAMRELGLARAQVDRYGSKALKKLKNGRYAAKAYDHLLRVVNVISNGGLREVGTRDSRQASKAGKHSAAVHRYLEIGDDSAVALFEGTYVIDLDGERIPLLTDLEELDELGNAGVISFETIYAKNS